MRREFYSFFHWANLFCANCHSLLMGGNIFGNGYSMGLAGEGAETAGPGVTKKIMYTFTGYEVISCSCISCHHYIIWVLSVNHTSVRTRASGGWTMSMARA